jgi:2'-5' RNA ligase
MATPETHAEAAKTPALSRAFVGAKIAPQIARELAHMALALEGEPVKRVAQPDIHLTLVPPWSESSPSAAAETLRRAVADFGPVALEFLRLDYGPEPKRPRLLWAECAASDELTRLRAALLEAFGSGEDRPFRPHVTLARLRGNGAAIARRHPLARDLAFAQEIVSVELFQSPPPGATGYRVVASAPLAATGPSKSTPDAVIFSDAPRSAQSARRQDLSMLREGERGKRESAR